MLRAAENAISAMVRQLEPGEAMAMAQLKRDNPALQARDQVKYEKLERALAEALGKRAGHKTERLQARLVAMIATGAMRIGGAPLVAQGGPRTPEAVAQRGPTQLRAIRA